VSVGAARSRAPLGRAQVERVLEERGLPRWEALARVEARYGGIAGEGDDGRELVLGITGAFGATRAIDGRKHVLVAGYSPIGWFMDEAGRVVEIDDLGERFYESDSIEHRIEQLALFDAGGSQQLSGQLGEELAAALGLDPIPETSDSFQRYWGSGGSAYEHGSGVLLCECFTPSDYGAHDRVWSTWLSSRSERDLAMAVAKASASMK